MTGWAALGKMLAELLAEQKKTNALLCAAHNLGLVKSASTSEFVAIHAQELSPQQMMDLIDPTIRISVNRDEDKLVATDTTRTPESLYPGNKWAVQDDNIYVVGAWSYIANTGGLRYSDLAGIVRALHHARKRVET